MTITNNGAQLIVYNAVNAFNHFYLLNPARQKLDLDIGATVSITPGQSSSFSLNSAEAIQGMAFNFVMGNHRIMMEL